MSAPDVGDFARTVDPRAFAEWLRVLPVTDRATIRELLAPPPLPTVHYEDARCTVYVGDALATLRTLPTASVDAVITDPPYCSGGISEASRTRAPGQGLRSENLRRFGWFVGDNMGTAGLTWLLRAVAFESVRVMCVTGSLIVFVDWRMIATLQPAIESAGLRFQNLLTWNKGSAGLGNGFRRQSEQALHFTNGAPEYFDKAIADVGTYPRGSAAEREHQAQKPIGLLREYVRATCPPGGTVCDPFAGSSSTGVAALLEGRRYIAIERDADHAETSARRLRAVQTIAEPGDAQGSLLTTTTTTTTEPTE